MELKIKDTGIPHMVSGKEMWTTYMQTRLLQKSPFMGYFFGQCLFHITRCLLGCYGFNG